MGALTVRIREHSHRTLHELADRTGKSLQDVLADAIEQYRRSVFLEKANAAFAALRQDAKAWREEQRERAEWDTTLRDSK